MSYKNRLTWLPEKLRTQIKDKNPMHIQVMRNPDNQQLNLKYKTLRNELISALGNSELKDYSNELELNKSDLHTTRGVLRVIIGKDANNLKPKLKFQVNDKYVTGSLEIANSFIEFFVSIGPKLADNILSTTNPLSYVNNCTNSIVIPPVTIAEVSQTILSIKILVLDGMIFLYGLLRNQVIVI